MNYLPFTILAYFLNALAVTADKFLLKKFIPNPLTYVFYISLFSLLVLFLIPFTHIPTLTVLILASTSTILWSFGAFFMFKALKAGQVSRVIPIIGTLTPVFLLIHASFFGTITLNQTWAVGFLILGLVFLTLLNWQGKLHLKELLYEFLAALFFAVSYLLLREAFLNMDFLTVFAWSKVILLPILAVFLFPSLRKKVATSSGSLGALFVGGQLAGGASQLLITFSISLATPALVNSLQGVQYVFLLVFSLLLAKKIPKIFGEKSSRIILFSKILGILVIALGLYILSFAQNRNLKLGVSYSPSYAAQLGLNPKTTFIQILDNLKVKTVRIPVYWDEVEQFPMQFNFSNVDYYLYQAQSRDVKVILVLGIKTPHWPECFAPKWVADSTIEQRQAKILDLVQREVSHFKNFSNIYAWQVENEPFLSYGVCDKVTAKTDQLLKKEVEIVKEADSRPVLITDSGELSDWVKALNRGDILGHTLYREVWNKYAGFIDYPLPPVFYQLKGKFVKFITGNLNKKIIISELQAEPWIPNYKNFSDFSPKVQTEFMPVSKLARNIEFARQTGEEEAILWGVEWWYYMAKEGHPEYLEYAKTLF